MDEIRGLFTDPNIPAGTVTVYIARNPAYGGGPGCTYLGSIDLTAASSSEIAECRVANDAATLAGGFQFDKLSGPCVVGGSITNPVTIDTLNTSITCASLGDLSVNLTVGNSPIITTTQPYAGTLYIASSMNAIGGFALGGLSGTITCYPAINSGITISGNVTGSAEIHGNVTGGGCTITGSIAQGGSVHLYGTIAKGGAATTCVDISGGVAGTFTADKDLDSPYLLHIGGTVDTTGTVEIDRSGGTQCSCAVHIDGDLLGTLRIKKQLYGDNGSKGHVRVNGAFGDGTSAAHAYFEGGISTNSSARSYWCQNYDGEGHNRHDLWYHDDNNVVPPIIGSVVHLGSTEYQAPNADGRVYGMAPSHGRGDCNGVCDPGCVNFADIDYFVALIPFNPTVPDPSADILAKAVAYPFMGDINCDGVVGFSDIDPFVALIPGPCGDPCGDQMTAGDLEMLSMATEVQTDGQAALSDAILDAVADGAGPFGSDWWEALFCNAGQQ